MRIYIIFILSIFAILTTTNLYSQSLSTKRVPQFTNEKVNVWQTIIYPSTDQVLKMHRHEYNRILIAFDSGILKITNNNQKTHYLKLVKGQSYYLTKDVPNELHSDENISKHAIKVIVIELKY